MYKKYVPDYSKYIKDDTVYQCKKEIKCEKGFFEKGSFVMLQVCNAKSEKIYIIDFTSVCERVKDNPLECDYIIKCDNLYNRDLWDKAQIPVNMMHDCFEKADEINHGLKGVEKEKKKIFVEFFAFYIFFWILFLLILFLLFMLNININFNYVVAFMIALILSDIGGFCFFVTKINMKLECLKNEYRYSDRNTSFNCFFNRSCYMCSIFLACR